MTRSVAINVGANTTLPGFRGPIYPDGRFVYVPIPEREPTAEPVPTYADLDLPVDVPEEHHDTSVHLDPSFDEYPCCEAYTYGDEHGVKARPLAELSMGDWALFYATLRTVADDLSDESHETARTGDTASACGEPVEWIAPDWGAYLIGGLQLDREPVTDYEALSSSERERFASNAHVKRETVDAKVLLSGDPNASRLFDCAVPLSRPERGSDANRIVTDLSADSGKGPWWRRPLRFDADATATLLEIIETGHVEPYLG